MNAADLFQALNISAIITLCVLLMMGQLVPRKVVQEDIVAPLKERNRALEEALRKRDDDNKELVKAQASALEVQSKLIDRYIHERGGGDD